MVAEPTVAEPKRAGGDGRAEVTAARSLPPGPRRPGLLQTLAWITRPGPFLDDCARRFGGAFTLTFVGGRRFLIVSEPDDVRAVFTGDPEVFLSGRANQNFRPFLGDHSLFVIDGPEHQRHRRLLLAPFRGERMRAYGRLMRDLTLQNLARWPLRRPFPVLAPVTEITLEVIFHAVFGITDAERIQRLRALLGSMVGGASALIVFIPPLQRDFGAWSPWGRFLRIRRQVDEILLDEIRRARAAAGERTDILAKLIEESEASETPLSDSEIRDELLTLLGAGHETTACALAWAFRWILAFPEVLAAVRRELDEVTGGGPFEPEHLPRLRYLDACVHETLRLLPPIPIALRWLQEDATVGGRRLPQGTYVCPSPYLAHRRPEAFPRPLAFSPERFMGAARPGPFEFFPFGGGNRLCIGLPFAIYETKVMLATVLTHLDLRLVGTPSLRTRRKAIILNPADGTKVVVVRRRA